MSKELTKKMESQIPERKEGSANTYLMEVSVQTTGRAFYLSDEKANTDLKAVLGSA